MFWVDKYAPASVRDILGLEMVGQKLLTEQNVPHLLMHGPPGTGKTTLSKLLCAAWIPDEEKRSEMVMHVNASSNRGISFIRTTIKEFATSKGDPFRVVVLDEADALTREAFGALLRIVESTTDNTRFIFLCNFLTKIEPAMISRCRCLPFTTVSEENVKKKITQIARKEGFEITDGAMEALLTGDMRNSIHMLEAACMLAQKTDSPVVTMKHVCAVSHDVHDPRYEHVFDAEYYRHSGHRALSVLSNWMKFSCETNATEYIEPITVAIRAIRNGSINPWINVRLCAHMCKSMKLK